MFTTVYLLLPSIVLCQEFFNPSPQEDSFSGRQFVNLSDANLLGLLLGIGSVLALTLPFLYLATLNGGGSDTGGYGYGGYHNQRTFNILNPLMPQVESRWRDQKAKLNVKPAEFLEAGYAAYS